MSWILSVPSNTRRYRYPCSPYYKYYNANLEYRSRSNTSKIPWILTIVSAAVRARTYVRVNIINDIYL